MNPSERATADALDAMHVRWEYEPVEFVLATNGHGTSLAFRPDFWLPDHGMYLEVTMAKPCNVGRKNKKARLCRELHGVRVEILYRRDFNENGGVACRLRELLAPEVG